MANGKRSSAALPGRALLCCLCTILAYGTVSAQEETYGLQFIGGAGYGFYIGETPEYTTGTGGFNGTLRIMWKPEHRLSIGLETGYMYMYTVEATGLVTEFGTTDIRASRSAVPIFIAFSMELLPGWHATVASGEILVFGTSESFGTSVESSALSTGVVAGIGYFTKGSEWLDWGGELKWFHASKFSDSGIAIQLTGRITPFRW